MVEERIHHAIRMVHTEASYGTEWHKGRKKRTCSFGRTETMNIQKHKVNFMQKYTFDP